VGGKGAKSDSNAFNRRQKCEQKFFFGRSLPSAALQRITFLSLSLF
jgi:hypothetical protein